MVNPIIKILLLITSGIVSAIFICSFNQKKENFADQALGEETSRYVAVKEFMPIQAVELDSALFFKIMSTIDSAKGTTLFLGNSQTHSINQMRSGEMNYIQILSNRLRSNVICHSIPNANLQEFLLLYNFWKSKVKIVDVVIPVFMDDLREEGIRPYFIDYLLKSNYRIQDSTSTCMKINSELIELSKTKVDATGKKEQYMTLQDKTESKLNQYLSSNSNIWNQRENLRGNIFLLLYQLRNTVFHINASTKRKMIRGTYNSNLNALSQILLNAHTNNIHTYIYIPPIRHDVDIPYDLDEYAQFKSKIENLAKEYNSGYRIFEGIVPGKLWGYKASTNSTKQRELDFMHFKAEGHQILADSLYNFIKP